MTPTAAVADQVEKLWQDFLEDQDPQARERLLLNYLPLVQKVAGRMKIGLPGSVEYNDLVGSGLMGLINSIDHFNPDRGFKFETYAVQRIRGAILDSLRDVDWLPRSYRQKARKLENAVNSLTSELGRMPNDSEIAKELGLNDDEYASFLEQSSAASLVSMDADIRTGDSGEKGSLHDIIADEELVDPHKQAERADLKEVALKLIDGLTKQERSVVALYYYEELTFREIGEVLGVSESRICQIHTRIIAILRTKLRKLME